MINVENMKSYRVTYWEEVGGIGDYEVSEYFKEENFPTKESALSRKKELANKNWISRIHAYEIEEI